MAVAPGGAWGGKAHGDTITPCRGRVKAGDSAVSPVWNYAARSTLKTATLRSSLLSVTDRLAGTKLGAPYPRGGRTYG